MVRTAFVRGSGRRPKRWAAAVAVLVLGAGMVGSPAIAADEVNVAEVNPADQQYRPLVHFTPEKNWMNDPNGMVYVDGTYHLFFQHNPVGTTWGNMSWGHATSTDLLTWQEQPIAIAQTFNDSGAAIEDIFSGSIVVDTTNSSGFGLPGGPAPLVAIYTSAYTPQHPTLPGIQAQSLAYSTDSGTTWTKYENNPVLNRDSANFRDPKVFWYDGPAGAYWVMTTVEATDHQVVLYRSDNLKDWSLLSTFGPANSTGGIWECPDLIELPVDGDPNNTKWVMIVNLNPGAVGGGSGGQYFVGDFDGTTFTSESTVTDDTLPAGTAFQDFETGYGDWTVRNEPGNWKNGPWADTTAEGSLPGQLPVTGYSGTRLANGFHDGDWPVGSLESQPFTVTSDHINLLVGGGRHPHVPGAQLTNDPPAGRTLFDFELPQDQTLAQSGWEITGDFAAEPQRNPSTAGGDFYLGAKRINTWEGGPRGDDNTGTLTSPAFTIDDDHLSFLLGGGKRADGTLQVELVVDGQVVRSETGAESGAMNWKSWDVTEFAGRSAQLRVTDNATGGWGHLLLDHVVLGDAPARVRSDETSVNLVVDGEVVRSATGSNSETLDWASWDVREFQGRSATIEVVDNNRFGWGHLLLDQVMFSDTPATTRLENYDWLDWGRDYYAAVSYFGTPDGKTVMQGWMSNWDYANDIPTSTWRSSMALPREVALVTTDKGPRLTQRVVSQLDDQLDTAAAQTRTDVTLTGPVDLDLQGEVVRVDVTLTPGTAEQAGITVFSDGDTGTHIGYDTTTGRVFVDRRESGNTTFHPAFASIEDAPVALDSSGRVTFELYLDRASVELFTDNGNTTITDQVFPVAGADTISAWAEGGTATLNSITVTPLIPTMWDVPAAAPVDISTATACLAGKSVLTVRLRHTGTEAATIVVTTPLGTKTFKNVSPKKLVAHIFAAPGKTIAAGTVTVTATATGDGRPLGRTTTPFAARTCP